MNSHLSPSTPFSKAPHHWLATHRPTSSVQVKSIGAPPLAPATPLVPLAPVPAAPVELVPAAPVELVPAAPLDSVPAAPLDSVPAAPLDSAPAAPLVPTAPAREPLEPPSASMPPP